MSNRDYRILSVMNIYFPLSNPFKRLLKAYPKHFKRAADGVDCIHCGKRFKAKALDAAKHLIKEHKGE